MEAHGLRSTSRTLVALLVTSYAFLTSGPTEEKNFSPNWLVNLGGAWEVQPPQAGQPLPLAKATVAVHISDRLADHEAKREPRVASSPSHGVEVPQGGGGEDDDPALLGWKTFMEMLHSRPVAIAYEVASAGIALLSLGVLLKNAVWRPRPPAMPAMAVHTTNLPKQKARSNLAEMVPQAASSLGCWMTVPQDGEYPSPSRWTTLMKILHSGPVAITYHVESTGITITSLRVWRKNQLKSSQRGRVYRSRHMRGSMWKLARGKRHPMKIKRTHRSLKTRLDGCSMMNSSLLEPGTRHAAAPTCCRCADTRLVWSMPAGQRHAHARAASLCARPARSPASFYLQPDEALGNFLPTLKEMLEERFGGKPRPLYPERSLAQGGRGAGVWHRSCRGLCTAQTTAPGPRPESKASVLTVRFRSVPVVEFTFKFMLGNELIET
ncbi:uncharacterized protein LOC133351872 [Lethenteron reissneri]|uniref:uncharacterized protein LOC133351872 n=1 Tax=Lethenteron reissneri TaxID=7753 RepID=UPI002AB686F6|nr:uncharacterized protein LOC133351872 [Lethenteron reissneri]XP_061423432.1 uncharacterized protein LOC133351872 [Lethenteron reissneri]